MVESLKGEESRLRAQVQQAEAEKKRLNKAIRKIIEAELKAERESSAGEFALTPEGKIVSAAFERNRSALPWPVLRGVLTGKFGRQPHPSLPGITIDNNGIDISTEARSSVLSVFGGTVSSTFEIPGAGWTVILSHGAFRTVYSNLMTATVAKGGQVEAGGENRHCIDHQRPIYSYTSKCGASKATATPPKIQPNGWCAIESPNHGIGGRL